MTIRDRLRLAAAMLVFDFWLDWYAAPRRHGPEARRELRANVLAAAERTSVREAVASLGSLRRLAAETVAGLTERARPRWGRAAIVAVIVHGVLVWAWVLTVLAFGDGASASAAAGEAAGQVFPWGTEVTVDWGPDAFGIEAQVPWLLVAAPVVVFLVLARPWVALTGRRQPATSR
ncbi:MAG: hypothetical protein ACFCVF_06595 [Kineosporiaceae bacterium]